MTGNRANLPRQNSDLGGGSPPSREWYNFFRRVGDFVNRAELGGNTIVNQGDTFINNGTGALPVGVGYDEGTSFPQTASVGQKFYRTDMNWLCFYDGTRWLTCQEFAQDLNAGATSIPNTAAIARGMSRSDYLQYFTKVAAFTWVNGATNNGSNYWDCTVDWQDSTGARTPLATFSTASDAANTAVTKVATVNAASTSSYKGLATIGTRIGSPSPLFFSATVYYRLIVT